MSTMRTVLILALCAALCAACSAAVIGIDFGTESLKVGLVKPGQPLAIVENEQSRRKTPNLVGFANGERFFSELATNMAIRSPVTTFGNLKHLIGASYDDAVQVSELLNLPYTIERDEERGGVKLRVRDSPAEAYAPEVLTAMILSNMKKLAEIQSGGSLRDCVIVVPGSFSETQRRAIEDAARLADLHVLQLTGDHVAAALRYGLTKLRKLEGGVSPKVLFVDVGASSATASVVSYTEEPDEAKRKNIIGKIRILSAVHQSHVGGDALDMVLVRHFAAQFVEQHKSANVANPMNDARAMSKLRKEAKKTREVLSANEQIPVVIESLYLDLDFRSSMTRSQFVTMCADIFAQVQAVVSQALAQANITSAAELDAIEMVGGTSRTPEIKTRIASILGGREPSSSLNADEAMALGAGYIAAHLAPGFKVRTFEIEDRMYGMNPLVLTLNSATAGNRVTVVPSGATLPRKRNVNFKHLTSDFSFELSNGASYNVKGLADAVQSVRQSANETRVLLNDGVPRTRIAFYVSESGTVRISSVRAFFDINVLTPAATDATAAKDETSPPSDEGENADSKEAPKDSSTDSSASEKTESSAAAGGEDDATADSDKEPAATSSSGTSKKIQVEKLMSVEESFKSGARPLNSSEIARASIRMSELDREEKLRRERARVRNDLETLMFDIRERVEDAPYTEYGREQERESLKQIVDTVSEWNDDNGEDATTEELKQKLEDVRKSLFPIRERMDEAEARPKAFSLCYQSLDLIIANATEKVLPHATAEEVSALQSDASEAKKDLEQLEAKQAALRKDDDLVVRVSNIKTRCDGVMRQFELLLRRRPAKPKKESKDKKEEKTQEQTSSEFDDDYKKEDL